MRISTQTVGKKLKKAKIEESEPRGRSRFAEILNSKTVSGKISLLLFGQISRRATAEGRRAIEGFFFLRIDVNNGQR